MKVGEFIRVENGGIGKVKEIQNNRVYTDNEAITTGWDGEAVEWCFNEEIIKTSPNIIDLIEVGDYVNGLRVEKNKYGELYTSYVYYGGDIGKQCEVYTTWLEEYKENEDWIETIVTKEQFEAMEYKCE